MVRQFNMNVNEVISNRCCQLAGTPLRKQNAGASERSREHGPVFERHISRRPCTIAAAVNVKQRLMTAVTALRDAIRKKAQEWNDIVKIGRTHMQDATPLTLGQEWSGYAGMLADDLETDRVLRLQECTVCVGRHGGRNRSQFRARICRSGGSGDRKATGLPFVQRPTNSLCKARTMR